MAKLDYKFVNKAPDVDELVIQILNDEKIEFEVTVSRDESGQVDITLSDKLEGGYTTMVLGQEDETTLV